MNAVHEQCLILSRRVLRTGVVDLSLYSEYIAEHAVPGQFVHIKCGESALLRRPISICNTTKSSIRLVIEVVGLGTEWLYERSVGETLDLIGPLGGKGFPDLDPKGSPILLVGGGCGVAPLLFAAARSKGEVDAVMGFSTAEKVIMVQDFEQYCSKVTICTDDGSAGVHSNVAALAYEMLSKNRYAAVFSCGNMEMLKSLSGALFGLRIPCYVSLSERMGCGLGACKVCATKTKKPDDGDAHNYSHVCSYGPVYDASEVVW